MPAHNIGSSNSASQRATTANTVFNIDEGLLIRDLPPPPDELDDEGAKWWNYYVGIMIEGKCMSRMFVTSMTNLCLAHSVRACYLHELTEHGIMMDVTTIDKDGHFTVTSKPNPITDKLMDVLLKMDKLLVSMGMTAYSAKVNNFDTKGIFTKNNKTSRSGPPAVPFSPQKSATG